MLEPDVVDRLESGCGLAVGFVNGSGLPFATRLGIDRARQRNGLVALAIRRDRSVLASSIDDPTSGRSDRMRGAHCVPPRSGTCQPHRTCRRRRHAQAGEYTATVFEASTRSTDTPPHDGTVGSPHPYCLCLRDRGSTPRPAPKQACGGSDVEFVATRLADPRRSAPLLHRVDPAQLAAAATAFPTRPTSPGLIPSTTACQRSPTVLSKSSRNVAENPTSLLLISSDSCRAA